MIIRVRMKNEARQPEPTSESSALNLSLFDAAPTHQNSTQARRQQANTSQT